MQRLAGVTFADPVPELLVRTAHPAAAFAIRTRSVWPGAR
jgi:hypothetical protein